MMADVFHFQVWMDVFMRESNIGFFQGCPRFDLLGETGSKKATGIVLVAVKLGYVLLLLPHNHSEDHCRITAHSDKSRKNIQAGTVISEDFFQCQT